MSPIRLKTTHTLPTAELADWGPAKEPVGALIAQIRGTETSDPKSPRDRVGVWECSPGRWRRQVMEREFAHFVSGRGRFIPDRGDAFDILPGDAVWFPAHTTGTWEITETLRKTYIILGFRPSERMLAQVMHRIRRIPRAILQFVSRKT
jgi:uncharacterized cupin superfamily protein